MSGVRRKIGLFTGNRAEYGLQYPILKAISQHPSLEYFLIVSGAHLKEEFGRTLSEIEHDGFRIHSRIEMDLGEDSLYATARAISQGILGVSKVLADLRPDFFVVYADRFESFSALLASTQMGIPTAHIEGGDYTEGGALDDSVRHAMTKLAHLHFTTNSEASERVLRLGEEPWRVFTVGYPGLDLVAAGLYAKPQEISERFGLDLNRPILAFTQHSVTTESDAAADQVRPSLEALIEAGEKFNCQVVITYPNDDAGGRRIVREIENLNLARLPFIQVHRSLGRFFYYGLLNACTACLGNSSSGIKETPAFHIPFINIGSRQRGRLRGDNVIDVAYDRSEVLAAIHRSLFDEEFRRQVRNCINPYGAGNAGDQIASVLAATEITPGLIQKKMTY